MEETFRAFVAVDVGALPGVASLLGSLALTGADLKLVEPRNVHVTVKFLGETPVARVPEVVDAMREAVAGVAPFPLRFEGVGTFGPRGSPRVVWIGVRDAGPLPEVAAKLDDGLARRALAEREKRPFRAHATIARPRSGRGAGAVEAFARAHSNALAGEVRVAELRLMRSDPTPAGPRYSPVATAPLEGR